MKLGPEDMKVFRDVVESRNLTVAADRPGRTKSAYGQAVMRLEDDLATRPLDQILHVLGKAVAHLVPGLQATVDAGRHDTNWFFIHAHGNRVDTILTAPLFCPLRTIGGHATHSR